MKKILIFILVCVGFEGLLGYSVHMFVGGQVSAETERKIIAIAMSIAAIVLIVMGIDIFKRQRRG